MAKKHIVKQSVPLSAGKVDAEGREVVLEKTFGAWCRDESAARTVKRARAAFRNSMERHRA